MNTAKNLAFSGKKIIWVSLVKLDSDLHKNSLIEILNVLARDGFDIKIMAIGSRSIVRRNNSGFRVVPIPLKDFPFASSLMFSLISFFLLPLHIIRSKPHYIITEPNVSIIGTTSVIPFRFFNRLKLLLDIRSTPVETKRLKGFLEIFFFKSSIYIARKVFDGITIITPSMKTEISQIFKLNPKDVGVWSSGVSTTLFDPEKYRKEGGDLRKKLRIADKFVVFYHGIFSANRGLIETIEAISILRSVNQNIVFFILGTGPLEGKMKELIASEKLENFVIFHEPVAHEEVPKYISMCDVGIVPLPNHPYWRFQSPLKLLEYLSMGKTVVLTDITAHRAVIGTEPCGLFFSSTKPSEIAKSIMFAYLNRRKLDDWGWSGRKIAEQKYSWVKVAHDLENYLLFITNERKISGKTTN